VKRTGTITTIVTAFAAVGCGSAVPNAVLVASPERGRAPLEIVLDASASTDPAGGSLSFRFDFDGDGAWDTELTDDPRATRVIGTGGELLPRVEVVAESGAAAIAVAESPINVLAAFADLAVDADRDGDVDAADDADEDVWTDARGAVFLANWDDDDRDGYRDSTDAMVNGPSDVDDLAPVIIRAVHDLPPSARVTLHIEPEVARSKVRVYERSSMDLLIDLSDAEAELTAAKLRSTDVELVLEGANGRDAGWDGRVSLKLTVDIDGEVFEDAVALRVAPTLFPDNTRPAERLYVMQVDSPGAGRNLEFYDALASNLDEDIELYTLDDWDWYADRWVQDNMQAGYQSVPGEDGQRVVPTYLATERFQGHGLQSFVPDRLLERDFGFAYTGGEPTSLNYGGNLEVAPPHTAHGQDFPFGRIFVGGGDQGSILGQAGDGFMTAPQLDFLEAQEVQSPVMQFSTEWLSVAHIDEIFIFVPDNNRPERPWRVVFASPALARQKLLQVEGLGGGDEVVFPGRELETTVGSILEDADLLAYNEGVQNRIDQIRDQLTAEMQLDEDDILEVPVLYHPEYYGGVDYGAAYSPGMQNLVVAGSTLFIPDPEGPEHQGKDIWQEAASVNLAVTGLEIEYVDVFNSYHLLGGEAHCGTNVQRSPFETEWWTP
jgi:protein-arginine deiminase